MSGVLPNGPEWECGACKRRYPEDYAPDRCECGHWLTRVLAVLKLA